MSGHSFSKEISRPLIFPNPGEGNFKLMYITNMLFGFGLGFAFCWVFFVVVVLRNVSFKLADLLSMVGVVICLASHL